MQLVWMVTFGLCVVGLVAFIFIMNCVHESCHDVLALVLACVPREASKEAVFDHCPDGRFTADIGAWDTSEVTS